MIPLISSPDKNPTNLSILNLPSLRTFGFFLISSYIFEKFSNFRSLFFCTSLTSSTRLSTLSLPVSFLRVSASFDVSPSFVIIEVIASVTVSTASPQVPFKIGFAIEFFGVSICPFNWAKSDFANFFLIGFRVFLIPSEIFFTTLFFCAKLSRCLPNSNIFPLRTALFIAALKPNTTPTAPKMDIAAFFGSSMPKPLRILPNQLS